MPASPTYRFRLYVRGGHVGSARAEPDLRRSLDACIPGQYELDVIDLRARADLAEADHIIAVPTVVRLSPPPARRAVGRLEDPAAVCRALDLPPPP